MSSLHIVPVSMLVLLRFSKYMITLIDYFKLPHEAGISSRFLLFLLCSTNDSLLKLNSDSTSLLHRRLEGVSGCGNSTYHTDAFICRQTCTSNSSLSSRESAPVCLNYSNVRTCFHVAYSRLD